MALSCDHDGVAIVFEGSQGSALSAAFDDLLAEQKPSGLMVQLGDYPEVFQTAFADRMVRRRNRPARTCISTVNSRHG
jgi:ATP-dependent helicase/nuclease subunit B